MRAASRPGFKGFKRARLRRRLWPADAVRLCRKVVNERVLTFNAPNGAKVLRFDGPIGPRIVVSPLWGDEF